MKRVKKEIPRLDDPFLVVRSGNPRQMQAYIEDRGLNVNKCRTGSGWSLLHRAAEQGQVEICEVLIHFGALIDERTAQGWFTPLHLALGNGWIDLAYYLLDAGASPYIKNKYGEDPMAYADKKGFPELSKRFRQKVKAVHRNRQLARSFKMGGTLHRAHDSFDGKEEVYSSSDEDHDDDDNEEETEHHT